MIAKLTDGRMVPCPKQGRDGRGGLHTNLPQYYLNNPQRAAEDGYYPVRHTAHPEGSFTMGWSLQDGTIVQTWTAAAPEPEPEPEPEDPTLARIGLVEDCLLEMSKTESLLALRPAQNALSQIWAQKIRLGEKTADDVPRLLRDQVADLLEKSAV